MEVKRILLFNETCENSLGDFQSATTVQEFDGLVTANKVLRPFLLVRHERLMSGQCVMF